MNPAPLVVHCIRHGESCSNAGLITNDPETVPLTELGRSQAISACETLRLLSPDLIISSPLPRAIQTAQPTLATFPEVPVETWPLIKEFGILASARWAGTTKDDRRPWRQAYWNKSDPGFVDGEGAESFSTFISRVRKTLLSLEELYQKGQRNIIIFGHGQFFLAMRWIIMENPQVTPETMQALRHIFKTAPFENGTGFTATFDGKAWTICERQAT